MNIMFYLHCFPGFGGMEAMCGVLTKEFTKRGHNVCILSHKSGRGTSIMTQVPDQVPVYHMPDSSNLVSRANQDYLDRVISENHVEIVLFRDSYAKIEGNLLGRNLPVKIITSEHNMPFFCYTEARPHSDSWAGQIRRLLRNFLRPNIYKMESVRKRYLYDNSDLYVLLSNRFWGEFRAVTRLFDSRKLRAIPNPLAPELAKVPVDLNQKENLLVFAGTLSTEKGAMRALKALKFLRDSQCLPAGWRFEILGDGSERRVCEDFVAVNKMDFVSFEGYQADVSQYFRRAKIFLFPSSREGWGNVLVEAMANGCVPIAFSSYGAVFDIIQNNENGFIIDAFNIEQYAQRLSILMKDDSGRNTLAERAVTVRDRFSVSRIADRWEKLFA